MKDLTIFFQNKPGSLADMGEILGREGINIEGLCALPFDNKFIVHILVKDAFKARTALLKANFDVKAERDVVVFSKSKKNIVGRPGSFGEICRRLASEKISIDLAYAAEDNKFVFGVNDIEKTLSILSLN